MKVAAVYLFFLAFVLDVFLTADFLGLAFAADFFGLAFAAVFFFGLGAAFFTATLRFGAAVAFRAAFLAAVECLFRVGAAGSFFMAGAGVFFGSTLSIFGAGVDEKEDAGAAGMVEAADIEPPTAPMAGALMAASQPGVNISRRSRETGLARPQRGQWAS
jgi:hypothetical protein